MKKKSWNKFQKEYLLLLLIIPLFFILFNLKAVDDWYYLYTGDYTKITPVDCELEPYDTICSLAKGNNLERMQFIEEKVKEYGYTPILASIPNNVVSDVIVLIGESPYIVFSTHYDKKINDAAFEAGMDNTAGVYSLLALLYELRDKSPEKNIAVVFTGEEETGFYGAMAFTGYARQNNLEIKEYVVVDSIGRGTTYTGLTGAGSGFYLSLFGKEYRYAPYNWNEKAWKQPMSYHEPDKQMLNKFQKIAKEHNIPFRYYNKMVAWGEDDQYRKTGVPFIRIYSDDFWYYFKEIHTYEDKVEYLDKESLDQTVELLYYYAIAP